RPGLGVVAASPSVEAVHPIEPSVKGDPMHAALRFVRTTFFGGLLVLLPVWLLALFLAKIVDQIRSVLAPVRQRLPETIVLPYILAALILLIGCFAVGLAVRTALGSR